MADEGSFQTGICSSNWWCTSRSPYTVGSSSPCSTSLTTEMGSFAWSSSSTPADALNMSRASYDGRGSSESDSAVDGNVLMDSQLAQSMTRLIGLSSPTIDWSHGLTSWVQSPWHFSLFFFGFFVSSSIIFDLCVYEWKTVKCLFV